jgi:DNA-binding NarL/FixJ family response regulator
VTAQIFVVGVTGDERVQAGELVAAIRSWFGLAGVPCGVVAVESALTERVVIGRSGATVALTPAQVRVLRVMAQPGELPAKAIARELGLGVRTVRAHILAIFDRLGVDNRQAAMLRGIQLGLVHVEVSA